MELTARSVDMRPGLTTAAAAAARAAEARAGAAGRAAEAGRVAVAGRVAEADWTAEAGRAAEAAQDAGRIGKMAGQGSRKRAAPPPTGSHPSRGATSAAERAVVTIDLCSDSD